MDKELLWIKNTKKRFKDGYNYSGRHPEQIIACFDKHMSRRRARSEKQLPERASRCDEMSGKETLHEHDHHQRWRRNLLQGLGS
jgi:hypothetical protein